MVLSMALLLKARRAFVHVKEAKGYQCLFFLAQVILTNPIDALFHTLAIFVLGCSECDLPRRRKKREEIKWGQYIFLLT